MISFKTVLYKAHKLPRHHIPVARFSTKSHLEPESNDETPTVPIPTSLEAYPQPIVDSIRLAGAKIAASDALIITAGAGMGIASNLPTFRKSSTFVHYFPYLAREFNLNFMEAASLTQLKQFPERAYGFWSKRYDMMYTSPHTIPHNGYYILKKLATSRRFPPWIVTSNIDSQFQRAGFEKDSVVHKHGELRYWQCSNTCCSTIVPLETNPIKYDIITSLADLSTIPKCPSCSNILRPNVEMWADTEWNPSRTKDQESRFEKHLKILSQDEANLVVMEVGAGTAVPLIQDLSETLVRSSGSRGFLIRINSSSSASHVPTGLEGVSIPLKVVEALTHIGMLLELAEKPIVVEDMIEDQLGI